VKKTWPPSNQKINFGDSNNFDNNGEQMFDATSIAPDVTPPSK
jgi:hypothetical protein